MLGRRRREDKTLACFLQSLQGCKLVVELKRDMIVRGVLDSVDEGLGLTLSDVTFENIEKEKEQLDLLHVRGSAVRYVHVPGRLDPNAAIISHRKRVAEASKEARRQHEARQQAAFAAAVQMETEAEPPGVVAAALQSAAAETAPWMLQRR